MLVPYHLCFKYIIVGDTSVGKSCLLLNYTEQKFVEEHDTTIGIEFGSQMFKHKDLIIKIQIWDTAGQESFRSITRSYYKGYTSNFINSSIGVVLCFDVTRKDSFYNMIKWRSEVLECIHEHVVIFLVGNKIDLEHNREVSQQEAQQFAIDHNMDYLETSAKTGQNVKRVFEDMAVKICQKIENKQVDYSQDMYGVKLGPIYHTQNQEDQKLSDDKKEKTCC